MANPSRRSFPIDPPFSDWDFRKEYNAYRAGLFRLYATADLAGVVEASQDVAVSLRDIYVPLRIDREELQRIESSKQVEDIAGVQLLDAVRDYPFLALSGMPGSGKSVFTLFLAQALSQAEVNPTASALGRRLVLPFVLREFDFRKIDRFEDLWRQWLALYSQRMGYTLRREFIEFYLERKWVVLVFDGFDELGEEPNRKLMKWLNAWIEERGFGAEPGALNVIVTGRPSGFLAGVDYERHFQKFHLQPFNQVQIEEYVQKWYGLRYGHDKVKHQQKVTAFLEALAKFGGLVELKHRPIYLAMQAYVAETFGELPRTRALAYTKMIDAYVHQLELAKQLAEKRGDYVYGTWSYDDKLRVLEELAYRMHTRAAAAEGSEDDKGQMHIQVSRGEMEEMIAAILADPTGRYDTIEAEDGEKLTRFFVARAGLLIEPRQDFLQFSHLTFQEFLTARRIHRNLGKRNPVKRIKAEIFDRLAHVGWREVGQLFFAIDTLHSGTDQTYILQRCLTEDNAAHQRFLIDLIFTTDHALSEADQERWLKTLVYLWVTAPEWDWESYEYLGRSAGAVDQVEGSFHGQVAAFCADLGDRILERGSLGDLPIWPPSADGEGEGDLLSCRLARRASDHSREALLARILAVGFWWAGFRDSFFREARRRAQLRDIARYNPLSLCLNVYLPGIPDPSGQMIEGLWQAASLDFIARDMGYWVPGFLLKPKLDWQNEFLRIHLLAQSHLFSIDPTKAQAMAMDMAMAIDMAMDMAMDMARDMAMAMAIDMAMAMARDMARDMAMAMAMAIDMARAMARDMAMARAMAMDMAMARARAIDMAMDMARTKRKSYHGVFEFYEKTLAQIKSGTRRDKSGIHIVSKYWLFLLHVTSVNLGDYLSLSLQTGRKEFDALYKTLCDDGKAIAHFRSLGMPAERDAELIRALELETSPRAMMKLVLDDPAAIFDFDEAAERFRRELVAFNAG